MEHNTPTLEPSLCKARAAGRPGAAKPLKNNDSAPPDAWHAYRYF